MRKSLIISLLIILSSPALVLAQTPLGMNYQGIARSADGSPLINQFIGLRISITSGPDGSVDFAEEHHPETNEFGLFAVVVGQGQTSGRIADVDWGVGNKWLQIEIDPADNGNYVLVGSQQLMSVPYALYAAKSGDAIKSGVGIEVTNGQVNNVLPDQIVNLTGTGGVTITGSYPNFTIDATASTNDADADPTNEIQTLSKSGNSVSLSNGGGSFIDEVSDADADPVNELLQSATLSGNNLQLTDAGGTKTVDLSALADGTGSDNQTLANTVLTTDTRNLAISGGNNITLDVSDNDNSSTNELQSISKTGSTVTLTNGGGSFTDAVDDADANSSNELQTISKSGSTITLSNGGGSFVDAVNDADANPTNEIQALSRTGNSLVLTGGGTVNLSSYLDNTDNQNLSSTISGTNRTINVSGGTGTTISVADNDNSSSNELITNGSYIANNTVRITENGVNTDVAVGTLNAPMDANYYNIRNLEDPAAPGDAVNLSYLEAKDATDYAISVPITYTSFGSGDVALDLSGAALDKGSLITASTITISEAGVYAISIQGISGLTTGSDIEIMINGVATPVIKGLNHYMGQYLIDLIPGDQIQIVVKFGASPEVINLQISAYKI